MGVAIFEPGSCNFPGVGQYYEVEIDQPEPQEPAELAEKPPEPVIPEAPQPPEDKFDNVAVAEYLNALQSYQEEAQRIQDEYKSQMQLYEEQAKVYQAQMIEYQEAVSKWNIARNSAVKGAEGVIESVTKEFGWAWVDKDDPDKFWAWLFRAWAAQLIIILVYFVIILALIKRKDVH